MSNNNTDHSDRNLQSYFRLRLEDYFKANHPIQKTASLLFPPLSLLKEMFANIHIYQGLPVHYPPALSPSIVDGNHFTVPLLWQILMYNITFPPPFSQENIRLWQTALNARLAHRAQLEQEFKHERADLETVCIALREYTLIEPWVIEHAIYEPYSQHLWRLQIHAYADFYLSLISTFDQAVTEEMIIFCAEENISLPPEFTDLTDSGFIGQILPSQCAENAARLILPDVHLLNFFHRRHQQESQYYYQGCTLTEQIGTHDWEHYLVANLTRCQQVRCNDWHDWLAHSGHCSRREIPPLLLDLFFISRAMSKFIQFQNKQLSQLGFENNDNEILTLYQRYPLYFNQSETFQTE